MYASLLESSVDGSLAPLTLFKVLIIGMSTSSSPEKKLQLFSFVKISLKCGVRRAGSLGIRYIHFIVMARCSLGEFPCDWSS